MNLFLSGQFSLTPADGFPDSEKGIEHGVSACYAGTIGDLVVMAGGCNFPDSALAPNSKKRFYQGIYTGKADEKGNIHWTMAGMLPKPMAYGVAATAGNSLIIAGGCNDEGNLNDVYRIEMADGQALVIPLPPLPCPIDNMAGALVGNRLYVAGGNADGKPSGRVFRLDTDSIANGWKEICPLPGMARIQPIAGSMGNDRLCIFGGFSPADDKHKAELAFDGFEYNEATGNWTHLDGPTDGRGEKLFTGGGIAINTSKDCMIVIGGVNKDVFLNALNNPQPDYLAHPVSWYRFNPYTLLYYKGQWKVIAENEATARAGAALAKTERGIYVIGGELKPRIRTPQIFVFQPK